MNLEENFHVALTNLKVNKVRTIFSMLGIIIGTCSVIVVIAVVNGTRLATLEQMTAGKENMLILRPLYSESRGAVGNISIELVEKIKNAPYVQTAFPDLILDLDVRGKYGRMKAKFYGVDYLYTQFYAHKLLDGRFFSKEDTDNRPFICVISDVVAQKLFGFDYPIGQRLRLENVSYEVVGVFKAEERLRRMEQVGDILVPLYTFIAVQKEYSLYTIQIRAQPGKIDQAKKAIQNLINSVSMQDLLQLDDVRDYFKEAEKSAKSWMLQMSLVAAISLLVGGVGLMNVMLISVTERTHEIGLRKALGANSSMLLKQFLVESVTMSGVGGVIGITLGLFISYSLPILSKNKILIEIMPISILASFVFSLFIGIVFGVYPASKAAHLTPVEALRYE